MRMSDRGRLQLNQARAVAAVAHSGSFARASELLHCSQSVVSRLVASAESLVGDALFHRTWNNTRLTEVGLALAPRCRRAMDRILTVEDSFSLEAGSRANLAALLKWQHLEAVSSVVRLGSATRAAIHLGSTQSSISKTISELARYTKVELFERTRVGLQPTSFGLSIVDLHDELVEALEVNVDTPSSSAVRRGGRFAIGVSPFGGQRIISQAIAGLMGQHDITHLSTTHGEYDDLCRALRLGEIDCVIGALRGTAAIPMLSEVYLYSETFHLFTGQRHISDGKKCDMDYLRDSTWLVGPDGTPARSSFNAFFKDLGVQVPQKIFEMYSFTEAENLIRNSDSIGVLCYSERDLHQLNPRLRQLNFDLPMADAKIGLTLNKSKAPSNILKDFERMMKQAAISEMY